MGFKASLVKRIAEEVHRKLADEHIMGSVNVFFDSKKAPFHFDLLRKPFTHHWKNPKIDSYDGMMDLSDNVNLYL